MVVKYKDPHLCFRTNPPKERQLLGRLVVLLKPKFKAGQSYWTDTCSQYICDTYLQSVMDIQLECLCVR